MESPTGSQTKDSILYNGDISTALVGLYSINYSLDQTDSFNWMYLKSLLTENGD